jgi:hypothetical protein
LPCNGRTLRTGIMTDDNRPMADDPEQEKPDSGSPTERSKQVSRARRLNATLAWLMILVAVGFVLVMMTLRLFR